MRWYYNKSLCKWPSLFRILGLPSLNLPSYIFIFILDVIFQSSINVMNDEARYFRRHNSNQIIFKFSRLLIVILQLCTITRRYNHGSILDQEINISIYTKDFTQSSTYGHRSKNTRRPVRSALFKLRTGRLVVTWVTSSESLLLYVFESFIFALVQYKTYLEFRYFWLIIKSSSLPSKY